MTDAKSSPPTTTRPRPTQAASAPPPLVLMTITRNQPSRAEREPRRYIRRRRALDVVLAILAPLFLFGAWQIAASMNWIDTRFFPAPSTIATTAKDMIADGTLQENVLISLQRVLIGFALGVAAGTLLGVFMGMSRNLRVALDPILSALYTVPKLALLPLLLLIFGVGEAPKVLLIAITVFFFMWVAAMAAFMSVPEPLTEAARAFGANRWGLFRHVEFPSALPQLFTGMRVSAGVSVLVLVGAEFVQGSDGIGYVIWNSWSLFVARKMYVGIVVVALMGYVFSVLITMVAKWVVPWAPEIRQRNQR